MFDDPDTRIDMSDDELVDAPDPDDRWAQDEDDAERAQRAYESWTGRT